MAAFDEETVHAERRLCENLSAAGAPMATDVINEGRSGANQAFADLSAGRTVQRRRPDIVAGSTITGSAENELDDATPLHKALASIVDGDRVDALSANLAQLGRWADMRCVADLRDPSANHEWLWMMGNARADPVPPCDYSLCIRLRLGSQITDGPRICGSCGDAVLDGACVHATCCALGKSTSGHNAVRDAILDGVHLADPTAYAEVSSLIPSRPTLPLPL